MRLYQKDTVNLKKKYDRNKIKCINYNEYIEYSVKRDF